MQKELQILCNTYWLRYCKVFPELLKFPAPTIIISNRMTKTAGYNTMVDNTITLSGKFLAQHGNNMKYVILPHELCHQIDFNLNGWYVRKPYHGKSWIVIMTKIGQPAEPYHTMELK